MKVKVIKCKNPKWWYSERIGEILEVTWFELSKEYEFDLGLGGIGCIDKEDVEVLEDPKPILPIPESTLEWLQSRQKELQEYVIQCMEYGDEIREDITSEYYRNQQRILEIDKC